MFFQSAPSTGWMPLPIARVPGLAVWVWYRPAQLPEGLLIAVPPDVAAAWPGGLPFCLQDLLIATGVDPTLVHSVSLYGGPWQPQPAVLTWLQQPLPPVAPGLSNEIAIGIMNPAAVPAGIPAPMPNVTEAEVYADDFTDTFDDTEEEADPAGAERSIYDRIESAWRAAIQMERQMAGLRQKLNSTLTQLQKLDRDLRPDERLAADREDRDAWHDARRWLRDMAAKCHREIKSFDIGMTSAAGRRNWMEEQFEQVIKPRQPAGDLETVQREFETYRKDMVSLQKNMQAALQAGSTNGVQRANRVLGVVARKIRERRAKMRQPLGGTNMDRTARRKS